MEKKRLLILIWIGLLLCSRVFEHRIVAEEPKKINAYCAILMDKSTGRILWEKNATEKRAMASTTKIMTCIIALENAKLDDIVTVSEKASKAPKVKLYIKPNEQYVLEDLLHTLMLQSSNDVAIAIAEHVSGTTEEFCNLMTSKARELGALNTNFKTPNGLDANGQHYSTAYDLALITRYALNNEKFTKIINTPSRTFKELTHNKTINVQNKNSFLNMYHGSNGVKTGYTSEAGYCFVGSAKREGLELISVVLASGWPPSKTLKWQDTIKIMDYGFNQFEVYKIIEKDFYVCRLHVNRGITDEIDVKTTDELFITKNQEEQVDIIYNVAPDLYAPVSQGDSVGEALVFIDGEYYDRINLISDTDVTEIKYSYCLDKVLDRLFMSDE